MSHQSTSLRAILTANAAFSAASGVLLIGLSVPLGRLADLPPSLVAAVGVSLLPFAAFVGASARRHPVDRRAALAITLADFAWALAAATLIAVPGAMAMPGKVVLGGLSTVVLVLGLAEASALRRAAPPASAVREGMAPSA